MPAHERHRDRGRARRELERLASEHGPLDALPVGGLLRRQLPDLPARRASCSLGPNDLLLGEIGGTPFYIDAEQYERWNRPTFVLDVAPGAADGLLARGARRRPLRHAPVRSTSSSPRLIQRSHRRRAETRGGCSERPTMWMS